VEELLLSATHGLNYVKQTEIYTFLTITTSAQLFEVEVMMES
jgi:hypothetical protein